MTILYSWNVNGIRAAQNKGFLDWLHQTRPDILAIQETKAHPDQLDPELRDPEGYHVTWAAAKRKGYSGVALFTRQEPQSIKIGFSLTGFDLLIAAYICYWKTMFGCETLLNLMEAKFQPEYCHFIDCFQDRFDAASFGLTGKPRNVQRIHLDDSMPGQSGSDQNFFQQKHPI